MSEIRDGEGGDGAVTLLPCPWCGLTGMLEVNYMEIDGWAAAVECKTWRCRDMAGPPSEYKHPDKEGARLDAIEQWNRRTPPPATRAAFEAMAAKRRAGDSAGIILGSGHVDAMLAEWPEPAKEPARE
jgi:hypothetical protein